jgi:hypothetical protein
MANFGSVSIVVDVLDEYPRTQKVQLLEIIKSFRAIQIEGVRIFITSRSEIDIGTSINGCSQPGGSLIDIKLHGEGIHSDIESISNGD